MNKNIILKDKIIELLSDGKFHSGEEIAAILGCTRSAVWKNIKTLSSISVDAVKGKGYRIQNGLDLLQHKLIVSPLPDKVKTKLIECRVFKEISSTNKVASEICLEIGHAAAYFSEKQLEGRGRRGREWVSNFGKNIYFSLAFQFDLPLSQLSGLSLATGAVLAQLLTDFGLNNHGLKWPNDILWDNKKAAGILVEAQGEADGPTHVVIGIGVNLELSKDMHTSIDQAASSLSDAGVTVDRNRFSSALLAKIFLMCENYQRKGLNFFIADWEKYDLHKNSPVRLITSNNEVVGVHKGIAEDGGICIEVGNEIRRYYAGEVSLRGLDEYD